MSQLEHLPILHKIAYLLNQEVQLNRSLQIVLEQTVESLDLHTGWIWLLAPHSESVYLAASYNLPPAFTQHPERLSGWCYCIAKYFENEVESTSNISEIACTRLKDLEEGTAGLRYHASVPLYVHEQKIGILNLLSVASQELADEKLQLLHTIGDMLSLAIQRALLFEQSQQLGAQAERRRLTQQLHQSLLPDIQALKNKIKAAQIWQQNQAAQELSETLQSAQKLSNDIEQLLEHHLKDLQQLNQVTPPTRSTIQYPDKPLTDRELEVLNLLKSGQTNKQIGLALYISERTVKFHISSILQKLNAQNRLEAIYIAGQRGLF